MCMGRTHHVIVLEYKSVFKATNKLDIFLPVTVKSESQNWIWDEIY